VHGDQAAGVPDGIGNSLAEGTLEELPGFFLRMLAEE
jgi:hypothetical protein